MCPFGTKAGAFSLTSDRDSIEGVVRVDFWSLFMPTARRSQARKNLVNPLALALGQAIEEMRAQRGRELGRLTKAEVAAAIGLKEAAYRLIELGRGPLHTSKALHLAERLNLLWPPLLRVVAAVEAIDAADSDDAAEAAVQLLRTSDPQLKALLSGPEWEQARATARSLSRPGRTDAMQGFVRRLLLHLTGGNVDRSSESVQGIGAEFFRDHAGVPPYYRELLRPTMSAFGNTLPPRVNADRLAEFERENGSRFVRIYGILRTTDVLYRDLGRIGSAFKCTYLQNTRFEKMLIAVVEPRGKSPTRLAQELRESLQRTWLRELPETRRSPAPTRSGPGSLNEMSAAALQKVRVATVPQDSDLQGYLAYDTDNEEFCNSTKGESPAVPLEHVWAYMLADNAVAFADNTPIEPGHGGRFTTSCTLAATCKLVSSLTHFWDAHLATVS